MKNNPFVSVIIPIYNTGEYLMRCLNSVVNQTYANIEIIIVCDGSSDKSDEFIDFYANNDRRIICFHKKNEGVSSARNIGLIDCLGDVVVFIDSDDYVESNYIEYFVNAFEKNNTQIEICSFIKEKKDVVMYSQNKDRINECFFVLDNNYDFFGDYSHKGIWACAFRKDLLIKDSKVLLFNNQIKIGEDLLFYINALLVSKNNHYSSIRLYHYNMYDYSSYSNAKLKTMYDNIVVYKLIMDNINRCGYSNMIASANKCLVFKCEELYRRIFRKKIDEEDYETIKLLIKDYRKNAKFVFNAIGIRYFCKWIYQYINMIIIVNWYPKKFEITK